MNCTDDVRASARYTAGIKRQENALQRLFLSFPARRVPRRCMYVVGAIQAFVRAQLRAPQLTPETDSGTTPMPQ